MTPHPAADRPVRLEWRTTGVPYLTAGDLAAVGAVLEHHAQTSPVERLERDQARLGGRSWQPVVLEIDGQPAGAPCRGGASTVGPVAEVVLRTFGHAAAFVARPAGLVVIVDDEPWLARETVAAVRRILRPRRRPALAFLASNWGAPSLVLALPVMASTVDPAGHDGPITWLGMLLAGLLLLWWLWWNHRVWLARPFVAIPSDEHPFRCTGFHRATPVRRSSPIAPIAASPSAASPRADAVLLDSGDPLA